MKFNLNDIRFSEFGFLIEELEFIEYYIDKIFNKELKLISIENTNVNDKDETFIQYTSEINNILKYNLVKSTFLLVFSNYESNLYFFIKRYKQLKSNESYQINRNNIKTNIKIIKDLLETTDIEYLPELLVLEQIRHILIHRNGVFREDCDFSVINQKNKMKLNGKYVYDFNDKYIILDKSIVAFSHGIIDKFYRNIIKTALNKLKEE